MRRYNIVACILFIFSVFSFVLAAPIPVQEACEMCDDAVDGAEPEIVMIEQGKRGLEEDEEPTRMIQSQHEPESSSSDVSSISSKVQGPRAYSENDMEPLIQSQEPESSSKYWSTPSQVQGSSLAPNYASEIRPNPSVAFTSGESKPPLLSTSGSIRVPWNPLAEGEANSIRPGTSTGIQQASSSKAGPTVSWSDSKKVILPSGKSYIEPLDGKPLAGTQSLWPGTYAKMTSQTSSPSRTKKILSKLISKLRIGRRISGTAIGAVTES